MTDSLPFVVAALAPVVSLIVTLVVTRRRTKAETRHDDAEADDTWADMAERAWKETERLRRRVRSLEQRWRLAEPLFEQCAADHPELASRLHEIKMLNGLTEIDQGR